MSDYRHDFGNKSLRIYQRTLRTHWQIWGCAHWNLGKAEGACRLEKILKDLPRSTDLPIHGCSVRFSILFTKVAIGGNVANP